MTVVPRPDEPPGEEDAVAPAPHRIDTRTKLALGIVAFLATFLGAIAGASGAVFTANINANAQTSVAQSNFLHNERQVAYTTFWTDFSAMNVALNQYIELFESGGRGYIPPHAVMDPAKATYEAAAEKVSSAAGW